MGSQVHIQGAWVKVIRAKTSPAMRAQIYNVFALMRQLLPNELARHRAMSLRWRWYAMAAKVVKTGWQLLVKFKENTEHC